MVEFLTNKKANTGIARVLLLCIIAILVASSCFIILHADHDCPGDGCPDCERIISCTAALSALGLAAAAAPDLFRVTRRRISVCENLPSGLHLTPLSLYAYKTRLDI